ncbi:MAG: tyrosine-type recombinase/integrase, partial [Oscillospiraceae bacterium]|nr:tyrosine-type recombinase/integrase [Oscillospiraceae bacterium]
NIRIVVKGNKERLVYLNEACMSALQNYLSARAALKNIKPEDKNAMFLSARTGRRLTPRRVQQIVEQNFKLSGLSGKGYSTHKLRHTAATLMYRFGNVDMLALKEILGHEHVSTTEIYTHIATEQLQKAVESSPLAKVDFSKEVTAKKQKEKKEKPE